MPSRKKIKSPQQVWESISTVFVHFVESVFFSLGVTVARYPWRSILITWIFVLLSCIGLLRFHIEKNPMNLWIPPESDFFQDTNWYIESFGTNFRLQKILITADNILDPNILVMVKNITNEINALEIEYEKKTYTIDNLCYKVPVVKFYTSNENSGSENKTNARLQETKYVDYSDSSLWIDDEYYCSIIQSFQLTCLQYDILDLWKNDINIFRNVTTHDIIRKINDVKINPQTGHPVDYTTLLGGIQRDENGDVVIAKSLLITWYTKVNMSEVNLSDVGNLVGTEEWVTVPLAMWELKFLNKLKTLSLMANNIQIYFEAGRSFGDISGESMFCELDKLFIGIALMFVYVVCAISRCNWLEIRLTLGSVGLLNVGMAYISAVAWCSIIGVPFGPVHSSLPFLLMGLGVDDMFVMNACWKIVSMEVTEGKDLPHKVGLMLKHAGVSIVITSFTDIVALLVGAITILPSLKSFCIYAAVGVFFIFIYSMTFYVAVFTLDQMRVQEKRNGFLFCYKHKKDVPIATGQTLFQKMMSVFYKKVVFTRPGKFFAIISTLIVTGFSIKAVFQLEQRFDPKWFIPDGNYYKQFLMAHEKYYPDEGYSGMIFMGEMNYKGEFQQLYDTVQKFRNQSYVDDLDSWVETFHGYVYKNFGRNLKNLSSVTELEFKNYLSRFLHSPIGGRYQTNFKFSQPLLCGYPTENITASSMFFTFPKFSRPDQYIPAMNGAKKIVKTANISSGDGYRSVWSKAFANWVTDEIIAVEVERNIELALLCVMLCTVILITNLQMCLWIFICVLLTIVNVLGSMQKWGMTVDIVCCIGLELAIGLCVDYAAHVSHTFLTIDQGSRDERAYKTVTSIGTAILLGGGSTLLSLSLLSMSEAYIFQSFFKIFLLVIIFGLYNGLIFLPVVLSIMGPSAYKRLVKESSFESIELNGKYNHGEKQIDGS